MSTLPVLAFPENQNFMSLWLSTLPLHLLLEVKRGQQFSQKKISTRNKLNDVLVCPDQIKSVAVCFNLFLNNYVLHETKIRKNITPKTFCATQSKNFHAKILDFQFDPVCVKRTRPNYSVGSDQDEAGIQYDRWSSQEWLNCEKYEKMPTS